MLPHGRVRTAKVIRPRDYRTRPHRKVIKPMRYLAYLAIATFFSISALVSVHKEWFGFIYGLPGGDKIRPLSRSGPAGVFHGARLLIPNRTSPPAQSACEYGGRRLAGHARRSHPARHSITGLRAERPGLEPHRCSGFWISCNRVTADEASIRLTSGNVLHCASRGNKFRVYADYRVGKFQQKNSISRCEKYWR